MDNSTAPASDFRQPPQIPANAKRMPALDGLRAIAILLVIPHNLDSLAQPIPLLILPVAAVMHAGWIGVQLFFVLSGFLITGNLLDAQRAENYYRAFFGRRVLRIFPLYYTVLALAFVLLPLLNAVPEGLRATQHDQFWLWTFSSNWVQPYGHAVDGFSHFWSLAIEEQFYLVWPFVVHRSSPVRLLTVCICVVIAAFLIRLTFILTLAADDSLYLFTVCRMDALACGAAAAVLSRFATRLFNRTGFVNRSAFVVLVLLCMGAAFTRGYFVHDRQCQLWGYTLLSIGFATFVYAGAQQSFKTFGTLWRALTWAPLRRIGQYSYGMYIFHLPLHVFIGTPLLKHFFAHVTPYGTLAYIAVMTLVTFALAALSYELFESRFLRLKRLFVPSVPAALPDALT